MEGWDCHQLTGILKVRETVDVIQYKRQRTNYEVFFQLNILPEHSQIKSLELSPSIQGK